MNRNRYNKYLVLHCLYKDEYVGFKNIILTLVLASVGNAALSENVEYSVVPEFSMYTPDSVDFTLVRAEGSVLPDECDNQAFESTIETVTTYLQRKASKSAPVTGVYQVEQFIEPITGTIVSSCHVVGLK